MFADDLEDMLPLPRARFDAVEWVERRADRRVTSRSTPTATSRARRGAGGRCRSACARSTWRSAPVTAGKVNTLPRVYGRVRENRQDPACLLPALARKPRAWGESPIRGDFPGKLRLRIDAMDSGDRQRTLRLIARASGRQRLQGGHAAAEHLVEQGTRHRRGQPDDAGAQDRRGRDAARRARARPA